MNVEVKVSWKHGLSFQGTADSGFTVDLGGKAEVGGDEDGFQPMELIAIGLAGCTAMDVISIMTKKRQEVTAFDVQVRLQRSGEHPKVFTHAVIEYFVTGRNLDEKALVRSIELSATRYCPAQAMFQGVFPIELKYHIYEDREGEAPVLATSGDYFVTVEESQV
jgi:putative redox protein